MGVNNGKKDVAWEHDAGGGLETGIQQTLKIVWPYIEGEHFTLSHTGIYHITCDLVVWYTPVGTRYHNYYYRDSG